MGGRFAGNWQFWQLNINLSYFCIKAKNLIGSSLGPMLLKTYCLIVSKFSQIYLISAFSPQCALTESQTNRFCVNTKCSLLPARAPHEQRHLEGIFIGRGTMNLIF
jgi:hypothetical protein